MLIVDSNGIEEVLHPKNYAELFAIENGLAVWQPFKINISDHQWFCFNEKYCLCIAYDNNYMRLTSLDFDNILLRLLTGELIITDRLGQLNEGTS